MSFSRAPVKRFNENVGCAPAPGTYDIKPEDVKGASSFLKSERFKIVRAGAAPPPSPSNYVPMSPVRRTISFDGIADFSSGKRERSGITMEMKQQRLLEKEIRSLVQQRGEQDRRVLALQEELKKVEAKLLAAIREKTGLSASVTTLERQLAEVKKANEFLKNKVSADTTKKRINSLTMELMEARNKLDAKDKELSVLQISTEGQVKMLETDLQAATATLSALRERNKDLEDLHQATKTQNEELENEMDKLHAVINELREEIKALQSYLDTANDQIQDLRLKQREKTELEQTVSYSQQERLGRLERELEQRTAELQNSQSALKQKEEEWHKCQRELQASQDALREMEKMLESRELELESSQKTLGEMEAQVKQANQEVEASQSTVRQQEAELVRLREVLRRTERELDERVAHLGERCLLLEDERSRTQEEGLRRVQELKAELNSLHEVKRDERKTHIQLQQARDALTGDLEKEKALAHSLSVLLEQEREAYEEQLSTLKDEMEEVLGELSAMEEQEQRRRELVEKSQEALESMQQHNTELEIQLREARGLLGSKNSEAETVDEKRLAAMRNLQEEHTKTLGKIGDLVTELESTKQALRGAEERQRELEEEVERVTQKMKEGMDRVIQQKEEEIKRVKEESEEQQERHLTAQQTQERAREEYARMLLEVQTRLAQKDEKIKATEASHATLTCQLQDEMQKQLREKEEALGQLEHQRDQILTQVQHEKEEVQRLLEKTREEKEETIKQLQQEREEKSKLQTVLQEERGAREMKMKDSQQQGRSEELRLQTQLEKVDEEGRRLHSQIELLDQDKLALQNQLEKMEQDRLDLRSQLDQMEQDSLSLQTQLELMEEEKHGLQEESEKQQLDNQALREQVEILAQEKVTLQWEMEEERRELRRQLAEAQEKSSSRTEIELWRKKYDELFAKVKPFQEQLDGFAAERDVLLSESGVNQEEMNRLANAYARLLGHQNQKQKIKHVVKLKDENVTLKQELSKLRSQVSRQTKELEQLKSELPGAPRRRFDPSKALQHDSKENQQPRAPAALRVGNQ